MNTRRKATNSDGGELSPQQAAALDLLLDGRSLTETATELGLCRQTLSRWFDRDAAFRTSMNARRAEIWASAADGLRALLPAALAALSEELQGPNKLRAASTVLRACGMAEMGAPIGPVTAEAITVADREIASEVARRDFSALGL